MVLQVKGSQATKNQMQSYLRQICGLALVDLQSGLVGLGSPVTSYRTGCDCIEQLVQSKRTVTIQTLPSPGARIPGMSSRIGEGGGGVALNLTSTFVDNNGTPGHGPDGDLGSDTVVYVDRSNCDGKGYWHGRPVWLILAHELTTGHGYHNVIGTAAQTSLQREEQAIRSENEHARAHNMQERRLII